MRIPTEFNDDNLYRRDRRANWANGSTRRLVRLVIGLALVVVVMRQASNEAIYRPFLEVGGGDAVKSAMIQTDDTSDSGSPINAKASGGPAQSGSVSPNEGSVSPNEGSVSRNETDQSNVVEIAAELDRVVDGSVWRGADFDAFYRSLDRAPRLEPTAATRAGVVPLLQQPAVFRGRCVSFVGTVARAEHLRARENVYAIEAYWQLWLRPIGGADRPLVAIVKDVPPTIAAIGADESRENGPEVEVIGVFIKRLAYQSSAGADLAPVIVGRLIRHNGSLSGGNVGNENAVGQIPNVSSDSEIISRFGWLLLVSCFIGFAFAAIAMWRITVMTRRSRALRANGRPDRSDFLRDLETQHSVLETQHRQELDS